VPVDLALPEDRSVDQGGGKEHGEGQLNNRADFQLLITPIC
jgi:hypothetical protein